MLLNPETAREALKKVKPQYLPKKGEGLVRAVRTGLVTAAGMDRNRDERAAGGRVARADGGNIQKRKPLTPDQIVAGIEKAMKAEQKRTEVILDKPDEAVVRALSLANQHL